MSLPVTVQWLNNLQLPLAGIAFAIGAYQLTHLRWAPQRSSAGPVSAACLSAAVVLVANWLTVTRLPLGPADALLFVRALTLAALMISTLTVVRALLGDAWSPWPAVITIALLVGRLVLWEKTDLVFTHRYRDGFPLYGPLLAPITVTLLLVVFGYLPALFSGARTHLERLAIAVGGVGSLLLAVWSVMSSDRWTAELLGGYLTLPGLAGVAAALWLRQNDAQRAAHRLSQRQRALAEFSRVALVAKVPDLNRASMEVLAEELPKASEVNASDADFQRVVAHVWAVAVERARAQEELLFHTTIDTLTGLANRNEISSRADKALASGVATGRTVAVAMVDLDRFGAVNDMYGHATGDAVLQAVANRLKETAKSCDQVGRFGSDEFVVVCSDAAGHDNPEALARRIHEVLVRPVKGNDVKVQLAAGIGLALAPPDEPPRIAQDLLHEAITAARYAKSQRTSTSYFVPALRAAVLSKAELERRLVGAVRRGEIVVHYQPIVMADTGEITGFECLARWQHGPTLLAPAKWIPIAEERGLIHDIGEHVLRTAVCQVEHWQALGHPVSLSVNVSAPQLGTERLEAAVRSAVERIRPNRLTLEITESLALDDAARHSLASIQRLGARTALDDFGTGFSALAALATLPINTLKIDRGITALLSDPPGETIVNATLAMAKALNMDVVAEGVETQAQHNILTKLGCKLTQGYFYSRPMPSEAALSLLATRAPT